MENMDNYYGYTFPENLFFGDETRKTVDIIWSRWINRKISEIHFFLRLNWEFSPDRFDSACRRAQFYRCLSIPVIKDILERNLDLLPLSSDTDVEGQFKFNF